MAEIKGLTIAIGADTKQFQKEIKAMDKDINNTNKQIDILSKSLEIEFDAGRFSEAQKLAQKVIGQTEEKAKALREELSYLESQGKIDSDAYKKFQTELVQTEAKAVQLKKKLEEINELNVDKLSANFSKVGDSLTKAGNTLKPVSIAAGAMLASFAAISKSTIDYASEVDDMAQQVNLSAEALQKWRYIAMQTGLDNSSLQTSLVKVQGALGALSKGETSKATEALTALGISSSDAALGLEHNFDKLINNLSQINDYVLQAAYANAIFGDKLGSKVIPLLNSGGEGIRKLTEEYESLGFMTNEQIEQMASFDDQLNIIKTSIANLGRQIGVALLPVMKTLADFIETRIVPAIQKVVEWFQNLSDRQKNMIVGILGVVAALSPVLLILGKLSSGIGSITSAVGGLSKALTILSAHPIIALITIIIGLIILLYTKNEEFRKSIDNLISQLTSALMPVLNTLGKALSSVLNAIMPIINIIANVFAKAIQIITPLLVGWVNLISKYLIPGFEKLGSIFTKIMTGIQNALIGIIKFIEKAINRVIDFLNGIIRELNKVASIFGEEIGEIGKVSFASDITSKLQQSTTSSSTKPEEVTVEQVISKSNFAPVPQTIVNNDYSEKEIKIEVIVQNYAQEVDVDKLVRDINIKLAEQM